ncbi:MAG: phosphoethanolamine--lipid A transferase [Hyphomonadaceae bacterium]|jgi:lipid A ethanolaminephosphotransferase|nr:phosphoethanolamine--lipid A transferase [Hyphomonadaceae bacterium]
MTSKTSIRSEIAIVCVSVFFLVAFNAAFWHQFVSALAPLDTHERLFIAAMAIVGFGLLALFFSLFTPRYLLKPGITVLLLLSAAAAYFINEYGIVIDADMIRNVTNTNPGETYDLLTGKLILYIVGLGVLPALLLWALPISYRPFWQDVWFKTKAAAVLVALIVLVLLPFTGTAMSFFRENRVLMRIFTPLNYVSAIISYSRGTLEAKARAPRPYGQDAHKAEVWAERKRKTLTVLVIGETARAKNFSLNGYARETNPLLSKMPGLIYYTQAHSCGTATAQSVPCMFSGQGRAGYRQAAGQEGLLHILQRAGFSVLWRENQGGCAGVCKGIATEAVGGATRKLFELAESPDENLLAGLQDRIDAMPGDGVIVLHMMGSHGPAYYKRYPAAFERFRPACKESQFSRCQDAEIVNSYDNTIVYTDYVLAQLIALLAERDRQGLPTAMMYFSDHGESLGEGNVYLHGLPYAFAPDVQKHVPFLMWLSPKLQADLRVNASCLERRRHEPVSHDNFFHSVLGLLDVKTSAYEPGLDLFAACRSAPAPVDD